MSFVGFPRAGLQFLAELEANNHKAWFEANRGRYQTDLLEPAQAFVAEMGERLQEVAPGAQYDTRTNGGGTLMRIYRDVRFSQDKTPYKNHLSGLFWLGPGKKNQSPAFGFQLRPQGMALMAGIFGFPKPMLAAYRKAVVNEAQGQALADIVAELAGLEGYGVSGEQYKRVPRPYAANHPRAELLKYKGLYAHPISALTAAEVCSPACVDTCLARFGVMAPLPRWLAVLRVA